MYGTLLAVVSRIKDITIFLQDISQMANEQNTQWKPTFLSLSVVRPHHREALRSDRILCLRGPPFWGGKLGISGRGRLEFLHGHFYLFHMGD